MPGRDIAFHPDLVAQMRWDTLGAPPAHSRYIQFRQPAPSHLPILSAPALSPTEPHGQENTLSCREQEPSGLLQQDLSLEAVGVPEEHAQRPAEIVDGTVARARVH